MTDIIIPGSILSEVADLIVTKLKPYIKDLQQTSINNGAIESNELMSIEEVALFLKVTKQTIYGLTSKSQIPFMKRGKRLYFIKSNIISWLKTGKNKTISEADSAIDHFLAASKQEKGIIRKIHEFPFIELPIINNTAVGIYFFCKAGEIVYIGKSENIFDRIGTHIVKAKFKFDSIRVFFCTHDKLSLYEKEFIQHFKPIGNTNQKSSLFQ